MHQLLKVKFIDMPGYDKYITRLSVVIQKITALNPREICNAWRSKVRHMDQME